MQKLELWHNISCSKSNSAKDFLDKNGFEISVRDYLINPPSKNELKELLKKLNISIFDLVRTGEEIYKDLKLENIIFDISEDNYFKNNHIEVVVENSNIIFL